MYCRYNSFIGKSVMAVKVIHIIDRERKLLLVANGLKNDTMSVDNGG